MHVVTYKVKDTGKNADYFREKAREITGTDAFVEVHPGLVRYRFLEEIGKDKLESLDKFMKETCDGVRT